MKKRQRFNITPEELVEVIMSCSRIKEIFDSTGSKVVLESDQVSSQIKLIHEGTSWLRYKLRDRGFDGSNWQPTPLTDWSYGGSDDVFTQGTAVEESIYCLDPRYALEDSFTKEQAQFIANPFEELPYSNPTKSALVKWLERWKNIVVIEGAPFPGYFCLKNIPGARRRIHNNVLSFLKKKRYEYLTAVPTWWHIARMLEHLGFKYQFKKDALILDELNKRLPSTDLNKIQKSSWIAMLQFWAQLVEESGFIPEEDFDIDSGLILRDGLGSLMTFPLSPQRNLWQMIKV